MMTKDTLSSWVLASASCFLAFLIFEFERKSFIDGDYYGNVPIDLAYKMGAQEVIAVWLHWDFESKCDTNPLVTHICSSMYLDGMLDFLKNAIAQNITLGYLETMGAFGKFVGQCYCFAPKSIDENLETKITSQTPFCDKLLQLANFHKELKACWQEVLFFLAESYMSLCNFERTKVWDICEVLAMARKHFESGAFSEVLESTRDIDSATGIKEAKSTFDIMLYMM